MSFGIRARTHSSAGRERQVNRDMRLYLTGLTASLFGNSAMSLVAGVWVKSLTDSDALAGLVSVCVYAPSLAGPVAGLIVDRVNRKRWLITVNLFSALTILSLLLVNSRATVWVVFVAMTFYGVEIVLTDPAENALVAALFSVQTRRRFNGWRLGIQETGRLVAPLIGAGLFTLLGGHSVALLDAVTFLVAAAAVSMLSGSGPSPAIGPRDNWKAEISAGARQLWRLPAVRAITIAAALVMALSGIGVAAQYGLVTGLGQRPAFLGLLTALLGGGSVIASLASGRLIERIGEHWLCVIGLVNFAAGDALRSLPWMPAALLGSFVLGFALPWVFLAVLNIAQRSSPNGVQGRVSAALTLALFGPQAPMQALGSLLIVRVSHATVFLLSAAIALATAAWLATNSAAPLVSRRR
jgi:Major Facilitator Superfamily